MSYDQGLVQKQLKSKVLSWWEIYNDKIFTSKHTEHTLLNTKNFVDLMEICCSLSVVLTSLYLLVAMSTYIGLKTSSQIYSIYTYQYLYTPTAAFMHGITPSILIIAFLAISSIITAVYISLKPKFTLEVLVKAESVLRISVGESATYFSRTTELYVGLHLLLTITAFAINFGYVAIFYYTSVTPFVLGIVQFAYAMMKTLLLNAYIPWAIKFITSSRQAHIVFMIIMVMLVSPLVATLFTSPLCLFKRFHAGTISVSYTYPQYNYGCILKGVYYHCGFFKETIAQTEQISPRWNYSYQCSSSLLTSYLTNFTLLYVINGIILPIYNFTIMVLNNKRYVTLKWAAALFNGEKSIFHGEKSIFQVTEMMHNGLTGHDTEMVDLPQPDKIVKYEPKVNVSLAPRSTDDQFDFKVSFVIPQSVVDITLLLTYGLASPLLSLLITYSMISNVIVWKLALGRYLSIVDKENNRTTYLKRLEEILNSEKLVSCFEKTWLSVSVLISLFWALFIFDMLADFNLSNGIIGATITFLLYPLVFASTSRLTTRHLNTPQNKVLFLHNTIWNHILNIRNIRSINTSINDNKQDSTISPLSNIN